LHTVVSAQDVPLGRFVLGWHCPALHTSVVQGLPSLQSVLTVQGTHPGIAVCVQPLTALQPSTVHALPSLQLGAVPGRQVPTWHVSVPLHWSASTHGVPLVTGVCLQPTAGSQVSAMQGLPSLQLGGTPATQTALWQVSVPLHLFASGQMVPFGTTVFAQPVTSSHVSSVHGFRSSQANRLTQPSATPQASKVQVMSSSHTAGTPAQVPLLH
jgi:hypothetical protein